MRERRRLWRARPFPQVHTRSRMKNLNIVIVERDTESREALEDLLTGEGIEVQSFASAQAAISHLKEKSGIVLLHTIAVPITGLGFVALAEHEEYLLDIARKLIGPEPEEEPETEPSEPSDATSSRIQSAIEDRLLLQKAAAQKMRMERLASTSKSGTRAAVRPSTGFRRASNC